MVSYADCIGLPCRSVEFDDHSVAIRTLGEFTSVCVRAELGLRTGTDSSIAATELADNLPVLVVGIIYSIPVEIATGNHRLITATAARHVGARCLVAIVYLGTAGTEQKHCSHLLLVAGTMQAGVMARHVVEYLTAVRAIAIIRVVFPFFSCGSTALAAFG